MGFIKVESVVFCGVPDCEDVYMWDGNTEGGDIRAKTVLPCGHEIAKALLCGRCIRDNNQDMHALLQEADRLRAENEVLEEALDSLGNFVRENLDYCAADFVGEGIGYAPCKLEYNPDEGNNRCLVNCWAEAFKKQAEKCVRAMKELERENHER